MRCAYGPFIFYTAQQRQIHTTQYSLHTHTVVDWLSIAPVNTGENVALNALIIRNITCNYCVWYLVFENDQNYGHSSVRFIHRYSECVYNGINPIFLLLSTKKQYIYMLWTMKDWSEPHTHTDTHQQRSFRSNEIESCLIVQQHHQFLLKNNKKDSKKIAVYQLCHVQSSTWSWFKWGEPVSWHKTCLFFFCCFCFPSRTDASARQFGCWQSSINWPLLSYNMDSNRFVNKPLPINNNPRTTRYNLKKPHTVEYIDLLSGRRIKLKYGFTNSCKVIERNSRSSENRQVEEW